MKASSVALGFVVSLLSAACAVSSSESESTSAAAQVSASDPLPVEARHGTTDAGTTDAGTTDAGATWPMPATSGPNDALAQSACGLATAQSQHFHLASRPEDAATIVLVPSATKRYHLHRPSASAKGYAKIQTADWHTLVSFGAPAGVSVSVDGGELLLATSKNAACSAATTDTRFMIHDWGTYLLTFAATGPDAFYLTILGQN